MANVLWTGNLSFLTKLLVNCNCLLAWILGNTKNHISMKQRVRLGYNAEFTDDVHDYEKKGFAHYNKAASFLLDKIDVREKRVLDVGCSTGILSVLLLKKKAYQVIAGDISNRMLCVASSKVNKQGDICNNRIQFIVLDSEYLPFRSESFDISTSGLVMGLVLHQTTMINEMVRVVKSGGGCTFYTRP